MPCPLTVIEQRSHKVLPEPKKAKEGTLNNATWRKCFSEKQPDVQTTARLTVFDIARDGMSACDTPADVVIEAANTLWLHKKTPSFLCPVIVEVSQASYVFGSVHRLSDDVAVKSLTYALWKSKKDGDAAVFNMLLDVASQVPISLRYQGTPVDGWFEGLRRKMAKRVDMKYEQDTPLAFGAQMAHLKTLLKTQKDLKDIPMKQVLDEFNEGCKKYGLTIEDDMGAESGDENAVAPKKQDSKKKGGMAATWAKYIMQVHQRIEAFGYVNELRKYELSDAPGGRSWAGKLKTLRAICYAAKSDEELKFVFECLIANFSSNKDDGITEIMKQVNTKIFCTRLILRFQEDFKLTPGSDPAAEEINPIIQSPAWASLTAFNAAFGETTDQTHIHELPAKGLHLFCAMRGLITGAEDEMVKEMLATKGKAGFEKQVRHGDIAAFIVDAGKHWDEGVPEQENTDVNGGSDSNGGIDPNGGKEASDDKDEADTIAEAAAIEKTEKCVNLELDRYLHAVHHPGTDADLIAMLEKSTSVARAPPAGKTKVWIAEKALTVESQEKLTKTNPFFSLKSGAVPPPSDDLFETWEMVMGHFTSKTAQNAGDNLLWWAGDSCVAADKNAKKLAEKLDLTECTHWTIIPKEQDLISRWNYRACIGQCVPIAKRRRFGTLQDNSVDRIDIYSTGKLELDEVARTWIPSVDWVTAAMPILAPVPLLHPKDMLHVTASDKSLVMTGAPRRNLKGVQVKVDSAPRAEDDTPPVILYHGDRHPYTYAESFNIFNADRAVFLTVGNGTGVKGALLSRTRCTAVFQNALHQSLVMEDPRSHTPPITTWICNATGVQSIDWGPRGGASQLTGRSSQLAGSFILLTGAAAGSTVN